MCRTHFAGTLDRWCRKFLAFDPIACGRAEIGIAGHSLCFSEASHKSRPAHTLWQRAWSSAFPRAQLLQLGGELAELRRCRRPLARCARRRGRREARVDLGKTLVTIDVLPAPDDAIGERNARLAAGKLAHLELAAALALYIKAAAVALGSEEHAVVTGLDRLSEVGVELDHGTAALELRRAKILEPMLRALHAMKQPMRAIGERHDCVLGPCLYRASDQGRNR